VVIGVAGASEKNHESFLGFGFAFCRISRHPIFGPLLLYSRDNHGNGLVESMHYFCLVQLCGFCKFLVAVANVASLGNSRPYVIVQIARQVEYQVSGAVSVSERIMPELLLR